MTDEKNINPPERPRFDTSTGKVFDIPSPVAKINTQHGLTYERGNPELHTGRPVAETHHGQVFEYDGTNVPSGRPQVDTQHGLVVEQENSGHLAKVLARRREILERAALLERRSVLRNKIFRAGGRLGIVMAVTTGTALGATAVAAREFMNGQNHNSHGR